MKKLKTLKDFVDSKSIMAKFNKDGTKIEDTFISTTDLKAEAVKCAKYYYEMMQTLEFQSDYFYFKGRYDEIIERNDLTEEDLK